MNIDIAAVIKKVWLKTEWPEVYDLKTDIKTTLR
jgi:hypothetical protein